MLPVEAAEALDTLHGVVRAEQDKNNRQTAQAVSDAAAKMEQARAEALKLGPVDKRFISTTPTAPRLPTQQERDAAGGVLVGSVLTAEGAVQLVWYNGATGGWDLYGTPSLTPTALTYTRAQLTAGTANPPAPATRIWDEHGSLRVRPAASGEKADQGITFALAGGRMAEREWDGKNVYTKWYGLKPGDDVSGYIPALAAVPEDGVLHWTPGKYVHGLAGYAGKGDKYNPLHIRGKNRFTMKMAGVTVEAALDLPNTTYYGGWAFYSCHHYRIEGWPVYDGRLDVRDAQQFHERYHNDPVTGVWGPDTSSPKRYSDPGWALLWLDGWRVELGCVGSYLEVEARRCLMDGILTVGNCVDTYLYRCVSSGNFRQGLSAVGVDGLTIDGGIYELTGQTRGPDGQRRGTAPFAGIDLEGEAHGGANDTPLMNKRVQIINKPEFRYNRGAGLMVHQYSENTQVESAHIHHNDAYGLNVDGASVGSYFGPGVFLEMNGRYKGAGAESFEVNFHGADAVLNGVIIVTDAQRAIYDGEGKKGKKILNVTVKSTATDNSAESGWVSLFNPDTLVDGLTTENVVPPSGYGAVHVENLTTGAIRNSRIRTTLDTNVPGLSGKAANAAGNEVTGYRRGKTLTVPSRAPAVAFKLTMDESGERKLVTADSREMNPMKAELLLEEADAWTYRLTGAPAVTAGTNPQVRFWVDNLKVGEYTVLFQSVGVGDAGGYGRAYPARMYGHAVHTEIPTGQTTLAINVLVRVLRR
ncbi:hypothetical protein [Deinococcus wulumuqiensis]|uniref:hypothetical protein n=1 Tax=Deinococcus wulumuqiensis TaxID=980427 RepID=UPI0003494827|nr:hypothetical protein [Deinococcus wulumuqiensis]QII20064.1 hypothetical protein G6R31_04260 [Deinococcus wulumuqiensis R12]